MGLLDETIINIVILQCVVLAVSTIVGIVAFGFAMAMTPFFLLFLDAKMVVEINLILTFVLFTLIFVRSNRRVDAKLMTMLLLGGLVGIGPGVALIYFVDETFLRVLLIVVVLGTAVFATRKQQSLFKNQKHVTFIVGATFAVLKASMALGGPILAIFALNQRWSSRETRAFLSCFFMVIDAIIITCHGLVGMLGVHELKASVLFVPPLLVGNFISLLIVRSMNERVFRRLMIIALMLSSSIVLFRQLIVYV